MRSKFEERTAQQITDAGYRYEYEMYAFTYHKRVRSAHCNDCEGTECYQQHIYYPDFYLPEHGFFIETKGIFSPADRIKMILMKEQHPEEEIKILFQQDKLIKHKRKSTRYTEWAKANGYTSATGSIPASWLE